MDHARLNASFVDGALTLRKAGKGWIRPWVDVGVRHQLDGQRGIASAAFVGDSTKFFAQGAPRQSTQLLTAAGFEARATDRLTLFASYTAEIGGGAGNNLNAGLRFAF